MAPLDGPSPTGSSDASSHRLQRRRAAQRARARTRLALLDGPIPLWLPILLGVLTAAGPLSTDAYLPAFPAIERGLHGAPGSAQLTLATWFAGLAAGQIVMGPLSDRFGRRAPLVLGTLLFTLASAGCALAWSITSLSVCRFLAAFGASASAVTPRAVVRDLRDGHEARQILAQLTLVMGAVPILAPSLGGLLLIVASWRAIFWIATFYGCLSIALVLLKLPDTLPRARRMRVSIQGQTVRYLRILGERGFITNAMLGGMILFALFAYLGGSPVAYVRAYHLTPGEYALAFSANAAVFIGAAQLAVILASRLGPDRALGLGTTCFLAASAILVAVAETGAGGLAGLMLAIGVNMLCMGATISIAGVAAMARHAAHAGSASALMGTLQFLLGAAAASLVGAFDDGSARPLAALICAGAAGAKLAALLRPKECAKACAKACT